MKTKSSAQLAPINCIHTPRWTILDKLPFWLEATMAASTHGCKGKLPPEQPACTQDKKNWNTRCGCCVNAQCTLYNVQCITHTTFLDKECKKSWESKSTLALACLYILSTPKYLSWMSCQTKSQLSSQYGPDLELNTPKDQKDPKH